MILPYTIDFTEDVAADPTKVPFQIQPAQVEQTSTALRLPGKGRIDYGELYNENLVRILENFSSPTPPSIRTRGQLWYKGAGTSSPALDDSDRALFVYDPDNPAARTTGDDIGWVQILTTSAVDRFHIPVVDDLVLIVGEVAGDLAYLSTDNNLYIFDGIDWRALATQNWAENFLEIDGGEITFI